MRYLLLAVVLPVSSQGFAGDLAQLERKLVKEPAYQGQPQYCLAVFGTAADQIVWLVRDGSRLYADKNSNGDLTEPDEVFASNERGQFVVGDIIGREQDAHAVTVAFDDRGRAKISHGKSRLERQATLHNGPGVAFAKSVKLAPVVHFNGPLTMRATSYTGQNQDVRTATLRVIVGTPGTSEGCFAQCWRFARDYDTVPVAKVEFTPTAAGAPPVRTEFKLEKSCGPVFGKTLPIPEGVESTARVTVEFPGEPRILPLTYTMPL